MDRLLADFFTRDNVLEIARDLLGKVLYTNIDNEITAGVIVETEAYMAPEDKASHAYGNKRTSRTQTFYANGGTAYVYMCYGIHYLFNIVTSKPQVPHAVLVRAIQPIVGIDTMLLRRKKTTPDRSLCSGPGILSCALGISKAHNGLSLLESTIWLEDHGTTIDTEQIASGPRVGVAYAEEYAHMPWRFWIQENTWVSKAK